MLGGVDWSSSAACRLGIELCLVKESFYGHSELNCCTSPLRAGGLLETSQFSAQVFNRGLAYSEHC